MGDYKDGIRNGFFNVNYANGDKFAGCTVHYVTSKLDSGKIILQEKIKISRKDNHYSLSRKVLKKEHLIYPAAIKKILS